MDSLPTPPTEDHLKSQVPKRPHSNSKPVKPVHRGTKRPGSHIHPTSPSETHSHSIGDGRHKRVWKACERCRMKKTKVRQSSQLPICPAGRDISSTMSTCAVIASPALAHPDNCRVANSGNPQQQCDGEFPCKRCKDDGLVCTAGTRKKTEYKQLPRGYASLLLSIPSRCITAHQRQIMAYTFWSQIGTPKCWKIHNSPSSQPCTSSTTWYGTSRRGTSASQSSTIAANP